jgi:hypothetical protein
MDGFCGRVGLLSQSFYYSYSCFWLAGGATEMKNDFPEFDMDEVALLITAVQTALERL